MYSYSMYGKRTNIRWYPNPSAFSGVPWHMRTQCVPGPALLLLHSKGLGTRLETGLLVRMVSLYKLHSVLPYICDNSYPVLIKCQISHKYRSRRVLIKAPISLSYTHGSVSLHSTYHCVVKQKISTQSTNDHELHCLPGRAARAEPSLRPGPKYATCIDIRILWSSIYGRSWRYRDARGLYTW